ncbi:Siroheme synthase (precorrin-2 oxidase/ferrochelatase domain) [Ferrimonas sediminum]|uniref:Siroheme synthase (Precorrin-2 oxidase/ferrochelatase domain) n=1 Tax=Ferrimonas sediminum TaxID=718193 RepID=A0A1G8WLZ7_9GAMM|nr:NAD(P)-dependent oxidoreductase [Ferrimonas sediminum]SDJ79126.1 Siroheme synthase (precorrin-2 oxidase/ferrochelatase domain) [Ferrimonas sediminum]
MMPLTFTDAMSVLIIGGGRAAAIKATSVLRYQQRVTLISPQFNERCLGLPCERIDGDVYQMRPEDFAAYQLIYLAMPWPATSERRRHIERLAKTLKADGKLLCVSCKPQLGNVTNPCSRRVGEHLLALSCEYSDPLRTRSLTEKLTESLQRLA